MSALSILFIGLMLGVQHATEADHLAAVATLATRQAGWRQALRQGAFWGLGHTLTLLAFAGVVLALGRVIPTIVERLLETGVGMMLVLLGADVLRRQWRDRVRFHRRRHAQARSGRWPWRALAVGMMHGLAGSAALVLLSLQASPALPLGLGYVALFGLGSIAGMAMLSVVIAAPMRVSARHLSRVHRVLQAGVGLFSCVLGAVTIVRPAG